MENKFTQDPTRKCLQKDAQLLEGPNKRDDTPLNKKEMLKGKMSTNITMAT
jgi:hypothetical protein